MLSIDDKQILQEHADTIESGLIRVADSIPERIDITELCEAIRVGSEYIERGLITVSKSIDRLARAFEKE